MAIKVTEQKNEKYEHIERIRDLADELVLFRIRRGSIRTFRGDPQ